MSDPDYTLGLWEEFKKSAAYTWRLFRPVLKVCLYFGIFVIISLVLFGPPMPGGIKYPAHSAWMQTGRSIGLAMYSYANDNEGNYPDGNSSTEVFQKLLDGGYVVDPSIFFISLPGKTKPVTGQKLRPENVCWDVTSGANAHSPDGLPVVFMTGYKLTYAAGGSAVPILKPYPHFGLAPLTWDNWRHAQSLFASAPSPGIAVFYKGNNATFLLLDTPANSDGTIHNMIPPNFKPDGKTYRQLTPDGPLQQ